MRRDVPIHYLRKNHAERTPPTVIFLDTETRSVPVPVGQIEVLRQWVACVVDRRPTGKQQLRDEWGAGQTRPELVEWVDRATRGRRTVWLYAHNLSFDLSTTNVVPMLVRDGWEVTDAAIGGKAPWIRLRKGDRRLAMCDSWSWLPVALGRVGQAVSHDKPPLPLQDGHDAEWLGRCRADVEILRAAILELMSWWDRNKLGRWDISGTSSGWNAMRHIETAQRIVIDPDPEGQEADRAAIYSGRRGVWSLGEHRAGPFLELDLAAAYPTVAASLPLPVKRGRPFDSLPLDDHKLSSDRWGVIARVLVETDTPRWPCRIGRHVWYPTGTFWTTLASPEIAEAKRLGCLRQIGAGRTHRLGMPLSTWGQWVLAVQRGELPDTPEVAKIAAKHWGRAVIGKWASRGFDKIKLGAAPTTEWRYEEGWDNAGKVKGGFVDFGGQRFWVASTLAAENGYPAILAFVESYVRLRLSRVIEAVGTGTTLQANTDGVIVAARTLGTVAAHGHLRAPEGLAEAARTAWVMNCLDPITAPLTLRIKRRVDHVTVLGPQHLVSGGERRFAGLPGMAREIEPGRFETLQWPGLSWQLQHGDSAGYVRPRRIATFKGPWPSGWALSNGRVVPLEAALGLDGSNRIIPWERSAHKAAGLTLGPAQHPQLAKFW